MNSFEEYMDYMFEHKKISSIISFNIEEKVKHLYLLCCDLMFPTRRDIIQSNVMTVEVGVHAAIIFTKICGTTARPPQSTVTQLEDPTA